jgi:hypothetical protein
MRSEASEPAGGWGDPDFARRTVQAAVAETTRREFARRGGKEVVWRARADGTLELARCVDARVELYAVSPDGTRQLVATSERSLRAIAPFVCGAVGFVVGVGILMAADGAGWAFALFAGLLALGGMVGAYVDRRSLVRTWLRERFGTDEDWVVVPHTFEGEPATGNQMVAIGGLADARGERAVYRMLPDGTAEVAIRCDGSTDVHAVDAAGGVVLVERLSVRRLGKVRKVRGDRSEWHKVETKVDTGD